MSDSPSPVRALRFLRGNILILTITQTLGMFCRSMVFPYASLYILSLGGEPAQIGIINSISPLAGLIVFPLAGYLTDRAGRVKMISISGYVGSAILLLYVVAPSWQWIAVARLLQGFMVIQFPATSAILADSLTPDTRGRGVATMNTVSSAFAIVAPYLFHLSIVEKIFLIVGVKRVLLYASAHFLIASACVGYGCTTHASLPSPTLPTIAVVISDIISPAWRATIVAPRILPVFLLA